jgi:hypothetical protein
VRHKRDIDEYGRYPMVLFTKAHHTLGDLRVALAKGFKRGKAEQVVLYKAKDQRQRYKAQDQIGANAISNYGELVDNMFYDQADAFIHVDYFL